MPGLVERSDGPPPVKRQKITSVTKKHQPVPHGRSRVFAPFRTVGLVSPTTVPFTSVPLGKSSFNLTTSAGRCLQTYDLIKGLNLIFVSRPETPGPITATATWRDSTIAAWSTGGQECHRGIWVFKRGKKTQEFQIPLSLDEDIVQLLVFGSWIVGCGSTKIEVWTSNNLEHYTSLFSPFSDGREGEGAILTGGICSLPTYLNKVAAGREDGSVEIWNVSTGQLKYRILPSSSDSGPVSAIEPAPAVSLVAIAYANGLVIVHDIRTDRELIRVNAGQGGQSPISTISFRTDGLGAGNDGRKAGVMATASFNSGDVTIWDLNDGGRRTATLRGAHDQPSSIYDGLDGGITKIEFLSGQAVLVTSGVDNCLKTWIFDEMPFSPVPRILHTRRGHAGPVTTLNFLPTDADGAEAGGKWLLSTSQDQSFWGWSLRRDGQSSELSQGQIQKKAKKLGIVGAGQKEIGGSIKDIKAPEITCIACSLNRDGGIGTMPGVKGIWQSSKQMKGTSTATEQNLTGWESVVTGHKGEQVARTWFWGRRRAGRWVFETGDGGNVTSVAISACGTFALVGSSSGGIDRFNLQSGLHRQRYPNRLTSVKAKRLQQERNHMLDSENSTAKNQFARGVGKHSRAVTGIEVDNLNHTVISCGLDGKIKFWDFHTGNLMQELSWQSHATISFMTFHRSTNLIALSCTDLCIRIIDTESRKLVRELSVHPKSASSKRQQQQQLLTVQNQDHTRITDHCFSKDGRWIIAASTDRVIRVWDLPTGHMIDAFRLPSPCQALAFSNTGEFLATALEDSVGVHVWTNRTMFTHVPTRPISASEIAEIEAPTASGEGGETVIGAALADGQVDDVHNGEDGDAQDMEAPPASVDQLSADITTLSLVPKSRWQTLANLELIRERNKPIEAPKAPEKAPFFLPSMSLLGRGKDEGGAAVNKADDSSAILGVGQEDADGGGDELAPITPGQESRIMKNADASAKAQTRFTTLLREGAASSAATSSTDSASTNSRLLTPTKTNHYQPFTTYLSTLNPSSADLAIRSLDPAAPYGELIAFLEALIELLRRRTDFELGQAWMKVFLRVWGGVLGEVVEDERKGMVAEEVGQDVSMEDLVRGVVDDRDGDGGDSGGARLVKTLRVWREEQGREMERLDGLFGFCLGVVGFLRGS
ncbi:MAG: hypothetical protein M1831_007350 [Alyxoria varia]|nr:MAG: hypothetical protein M1831_007350 [Alyxoria varia]